MKFITWSIYKRREEGKCSLVTPKYLISGVKLPLLSLLPQQNTVIKPYSTLEQAEHFGHILTSQTSLRASQPVPSAVSYPPSSSLASNSLLHLRFSSFTGLHKPLLLPASHPASHLHASCPLHPWASDASAFLSFFITVEDVNFCPEGCWLESQVSLYYWSYEWGPQNQICSGKNNQLYKWAEKKKKL